MTDYELVAVSVRNIHVNYCLWVVKIVEHGKNSLEKLQNFRQQQLRHVLELVQLWILLL